MVLSTDVYTVPFVPSNLDPPPDVVSPASLPSLCPINTSVSVGGACPGFKLNGVPGCVSCFNNTPAAEVARGTHSLVMCALS